MDDLASDVYTTPKKPSVSAENLVSIEDIAEEVEYIAEEVNEKTPVMLKMTKYWLQGRPKRLSET